MGETLDPSERELLETFAMDRPTSAVDHGMEDAIFLPLTEHARRFELCAAASLKGSPETEEARNFYQRWRERVPPRIPFWVPDEALALLADLYDGGTDAERFTRWGGACRTLKGLVETYRSGSWPPEAATIVRDTVAVWQFGVWRERLPLDDHPEDFRPSVSPMAADRVANLFHAMAAECRKRTYGSGNLSGTFFFHVREKIVPKLARDLDIELPPWAKPKLETVEDCDRERAKGVERWTTEKEEEKRTADRKWFEAAAAKLEARAKSKASEAPLLPVSPADRDSDDSGMETGSPMSLEEKALGLLAVHPDWSVTRIAEGAGCSRTTLYKLPRFSAALNAQAGVREELRRQKRRHSST